VEENEELNEPATFIFYMLFADRINTYWVDDVGNPKSLTSFFN
jgi:hypothetical protein